MNRTKEQQEKLDLAASHGHATSAPILEIKRKTLPEYAPTWEAGRASGFHAGLLYGRDKLESEVYAQLDRERSIWHDLHNGLNEKIEKLKLQISELELLLANEKKT